MRKLYKYIEKERNYGYEIHEIYLPNEGPGFVNYERECIILNTMYLNGEREDFGEENLIDVIYHELGHLEYFRMNPISKDHFNEDFRIKSEYYAFYYSLEKLFEIAINGDAEPLIASINWLKERIRKLLANSLEDETLTHCKALEMISECDLYQKCLNYINSLN